jgi:hypothetical protein
MEQNHHTLVGRSISWKSSSSPADNHHISASSMRGWKIDHEAARITRLALLPDAAGDPQLELLPVAAGEEKGHLPVNDQPVVAVPHSPVAVPDASWRALPCQLPPLPAHLQAVAEALCLALLTHEPQECHVHWRHAQQECLKVEAEVLPKTFENLQNHHQHQV